MIFLCCRSYGAVKPSEDRPRRPWEAKSHIPLQDQPNREEDDLSKLRVQVDWVSFIIKFNCLKRLATT